MKEGWNWFKKGEKKTWKCERERTRKYERERKNKNGRQIKRGNLLDLPQHVRVKEHHNSNIILFALLSFLFSFFSFFLSLPFFSFLCKTNSWYSSYFSLSYILTLASSLTIQLVHEIKLKIWRIFLEEGLIFLPSFPFSHFSIPSWKMSDGESHWIKSPSN